MSELSVRRPRVEGVRIDYYLCPVCEEGRWASGERCLSCAGSGFTSDVGGWPEEELVRAPRPPAVMKSPCGDCAFRPGSPEREEDPELTEHCQRDRPFWCHKGMPVVNGSYTPTAWIGSIPLGSLVCSGWWDWRETGQLPTVACGPELPAKPLRSS